MALSASIQRRLQDQRILLANAGSMVGSVGVGSILGFATWWLAARLFARVEVGLASAAVAAMSLLAIVATLGLGTLLMGELPRQPQRAGRLISTALIVVATAGFLLGCLFIVLAPLIVPDLVPLAVDPVRIALFSSGVSVAAAATVLDQALIGLLRGPLQLRRNIVFAIVRLGLLPAALLVPGERALAIYVFWGVSILVSLAGLIRHIPPAERQWRNWWPDLRLVQQLGGSAMSHHALNLTLQAPSQMLPLVVTATLSAEQNAGFYIAWMLASFVFTVPVSLATVLYTIGAADRIAFAAKIRTTMLSSTVVVAGCAIVLMSSAPLILGMFGTSYATDANWCLRLVALGAFPVIIRTHFVAVCRVERRTAEATLFTAVGGLIELSCAILGASFGGLTGLACGWLLAVTIQATCMAPTLYRTACVATPWVEANNIGPGSFWQFGSKFISRIQNGQANTDSPQ